MKIKKITKLIKNAQGSYTLPINIGRGLGARMISVDVSLQEIQKSLVYPTSLSQLGGRWLIYKNYGLEADTCVDQLTEEDILEIKHAILKTDKRLDKISKEVEAFENFDKAADARREKLSDQVKLFVWQRDQGQCVKCGSHEKLEFDHIIPVVRGGSNTERNIQLLCESCNRSKGKDI